MELVHLPDDQFLSSTAWLAKLLAQFSICHVNGHVSLNNSRENRNSVPPAIEFDIGEISANSADPSLVEKGSEVSSSRARPVESVTREPEDFVLWWTTTE
jgi:hypothetical protein